MLISQIPGFNFNWCTFLPFNKLIYYPWMIVDFITFGYQCGFRSDHIIPVTPHEHHGVSNHRELDHVLNKLFRLTTVECIKAPHCWSFVTGIHLWPVNYPKWELAIRVTSWWARWRLKSCLDYLLNRLFWCKSTKTTKFRVTGLCEGNSPVTSEFPSQRASNAENFHFPYDDVILKCGKHLHAMTSSWDHIIYKRMPAVINEIELLRRINDCSSWCAPSDFGSVAFICPSFSVNCIHLIAKVVCELWNG